MRLQYRAHSDTGIWIMIGLIVTLIASWATHIIWVIGTLAGEQGITGGQILLGILGTFVPPVGVIHGFMIWFGSGM